MNIYTLALSAAFLSALSLTAAADAKSDADRQISMHTAMGAQARASKDFVMAAHCTKLVQKFRADAAAATRGAGANAPQDHAALAVQAEKNAAAHEAMLTTASTHRDPGMAAHCRRLIEKYTAEAAEHRTQAMLAGGR